MGSDLANKETTIPIYYSATTNILQTTCTTSLQCELLHCPAEKRAIGTMDSSNRTDVQKMLSE